MRADALQQPLPGSGCQTRVDEAACFVAGHVT